MREKRTTSETPTYDRLIETFTEMKASRGDRPMHPAESALRRVHSKAITSGQRAGGRAAHNVWRPYEFMTLDQAASTEIAQRANEAAKVASARARERYVVKSGVLA
jgi:hypothetical protein